MIALSNRSAPVRNDLAVDESREMRQHGLWLVVRRLVAGLVQPQEAEVPILPDLPLFLSVYQERGVVADAELGRGLVLERQTDSLSSEPVALPVAC